jgi:hypothetical protein
MDEPARRGHLNRRRSPIDAPETSFRRALTDWNVRHTISSRPARIARARRGEPEWGLATNSGPKMGTGESLSAFAPRDA